MDKTGQIEELAKILDDFIDGSWDIAEALYAAGYRKVKKPPVLTDEEIFDIVDSTRLRHNPYACTDYVQINPHKTAKLVAQAQRDFGHRFVMEGK